MPITNWHSIRLQGPEKYDEWSQTKGGFLYGKSVKVPTSVGIVWGHPKGKAPKIWVAQALRFPMKSYTVAQVTKWAKDNLKSWVKIEPGKGVTTASLERRVQTVKEIKTYGEDIRFMTPMEAFFSLRTALEKAVSYKFGQDAFVHDFSNKEVVIGFSKSNIHPLSSWESGEYEKTGYKLIKGGEIGFVGMITKVKKSVSYEGLSLDMWRTMWEMEGEASVETEKERKETERLKKICRTCS